MTRFRQQNTVGGVANISGTGYWSGATAKVEFHPAEPGAGITFVHTGTSPASRIQASVSQRIEQPRRTTLRDGSASVEMVEHILAALAGLQVDNCEVHIDQNEAPGFDGSSQAFVEAIDSVGVKKQDALRPVLVISEPLRVGDEEAWIEARPSRWPGLKLKYRLDYGMEHPIGRQSIELQITPQKFRKELASARTFLMKEEAEWLQAQGLGGHVTPQDLLIFDDMGPIENAVRFEDECVRHKALDVVGDLALAGCDIHGYVVAHRSGHRLNASLVNALLLENEIIDSGRAA